MATDPDSSLRLFLLGRFAVERDGEPIPGKAWKRRRPVELLTALALAPGHLLHREEIMDRMWPDKDLEAAANNLYRAIHDLRRTVGEHALAVERDGDRGVDRSGRGGAVRRARARERQPAARADRGLRLLRGRTPACDRKDISQRSGCHSRTFPIRCRRH